jgi:thioredoxin 1
LKSGLLDLTDILELNEGNWEKEISNSTKLTVIECRHDNCPFCAKLEPILNEIAKEYEGRIRFARLNVLANPFNKKMAFRLGVMSTPTIVFFCQGRTVEQLAGLMTKKQLERKFDDVLQKYKQCLKQSTAVV